jgi:hypothetical protein
MRVRRSKFEPRAFQVVAGSELVIWSVIAIAFREFLIRSRMLFSHAGKNSFRG